MPTIHFLNVLEGDCNIIQHETRTTVIDVSNASNDNVTDDEKNIRESEARKKMFSSIVPEGKTNYRQKEDPDNPIEYLQKLNVKEIWRFIITHPDMDHLDGIKDLYSEFDILHTWDTDNDKELDLENFGGGYNPEDWKHYLKIRGKKYTQTTRLTPKSGSEEKYWTNDNIKILCPTKSLVDKANESEDYNHASYALLYTPPKSNGGHWKILFAGDTHDASWEHILEQYEDDVKDIDILFAPHHGRDSDRNYDFLKTLKPTITLFGNAKSKYLAYDKYPDIITNNQAGYIVMNVTDNRVEFYVKNEKFANDYREKEGWSKSTYSHKHDGWFLFSLKP